MTMIHYAELLAQHRTSMQQFGRDTLFNWYDRQKERHMVGHLKRYPCSYSLDIANPRLVQTASWNSVGAPILAVAADLANWMRESPETIVGFEYAPVISFPDADTAFMFRLSF